MDMTYITEFKGIDKGKKVNYPVIAISGLSGSGKGVHSKLLKKRLKEEYGLELPIYESGEYFRQEAEKRGMTVEEFGALLKKDKRLLEKVDRGVDEKTLRNALKKPGIYVGRLTTHIIGEHGYKVFLKADVDLVAERISNDPNRDEVKRGMSRAEIKAEIIKRDRDNAKRYRDLYGINYDKDLPGRADSVVVNDRPPEVVFKDFYRLLTKWLKEKGYVK
jgi:cytidylate kinase